MSQNHNYCKDPKGCIAKRAAFAKLNTLALEKLGYAEYEALREVFAVEGFDGIRLSKHNQYRSCEKAISNANIRTVMLEGDPIEYFENKYGTKKITLWGNIRIGKGVYRPLHIILKKRREEEIWTVVTSYDPRSKPWQWDNNFTVRICFCKEE